MGSGGRGQTYNHKMFSLPSCLNFRMVGARTKGDGPEG